MKPLDKYKIAYNKKPICMLNEYAGFQGRVDPDSGGDSGSVHHGESAEVKEVAVHLGVCVQLPDLQAQTDSKGIGLS